MFPVTRVGLIDSQSLKLIGLFCMLGGDNSAPGKKLEGRYQKFNKDLKTENQYLCARGIALLMTRLEQNGFRF